LQNKTTIDSQTEKLFEKQQHWRADIEKIIKSIKFLSQQCFTFRGTLDVLYKGNFLKLIELFAKFDTVLAIHLLFIKL